ncbi:MAG: pyruvate carboxylase, partial [Chitinivibrionales bacterium]|nr:pyruvate carboxylase [Chitinivibrionales bacterium]
QVFKDFARHVVAHVDTSMLSTPTFLYGLQPGEEIAVDIEKGKTLIIKFLSVGEPHEDGARLVTFELNGHPRSVTITDRSLAGNFPTAVKADPANPDHIGATMPGMVVKVHVEEGTEVSKGHKLLVLEAMKMETTIYAEKAGKVGQVLVKPGNQVETGDLLLSIG